MGVEIVDSIADLLKKVDFVLLETNDGRPHLEQGLEVIKAGKPSVHRQARSRYTLGCNRALYNL